MRHVRILAPRGLFLGSCHYPHGAVAPVDDDRRASVLIAQGLVENAVVLETPPVESAAAPPAPEKAVSRRQK